MGLPRLRSTFGSRASFYGIRFSRTFYGTRSVRVRMLNFSPALAFNGWFAFGVGFHPRNAAGRARTGASEARIGHTPFHLLTRSLPVSGNPELNGRLIGKRVWRRNYAPNHYLWTPLRVERSSPDPGVHFCGPGVHFCRPARDCGPFEIWAKPPELGDYSGRMRGLIARRFWTVEFGRVSVRNSPFGIFPRNLRSVSRNSHGWVLRALWLTFPRVISSNVISALNYIRCCDNFLGSSISYLLKRLAIFPRGWLCSFLRKKAYVENSALSYLIFSFLKKHLTQVLPKSTWARILRLVSAVALAFSAGK